MLGCHVSRESQVLDDAPTLAIPEAISRDCDAYGFNFAQIFTHGPQGYKANDIDRQALAEQTDIGLVVHGAYTLSALWKITEDNINTGRSQASLGFLKAQLQAAREIGAIGVVVHIGRVDPSIAAYVMSKAKPLARQTGVKIILEMTASKATEWTYDTPEKINALSRAIGPRENWWAWCVDTAHIWAAGQNITTRHAAQDWFARLEYPARIALIHLNGSSNARGSGKDTHEVPGSNKDLIWHNTAWKDSGIAAVIEFATTHDIPMILEINRGSQDSINHCVQQIAQQIGVHHGGQDEQAADEPTTEPAANIDSPLA